MTAETIYALSTAPGKAGVAVIRVSGPGAHESFRALTGRRHALDPRRTALMKITDPQSGTMIDEAMIILFRGPESFTGEDVAEYHVHGSIAVTEALLRALSHQPRHRMAQPGEFTRHAFENGKMDLTEAEAVADLIDAETEAQRDQALQQMGGALSRLYEGWRTELARALAYIEAVIDFPEEDVPDSEITKVAPALELLQQQIAAHLDDGRRGERLRHGLKVAVIGAPNAGKSSLVNTLAQRDIAIVSDLAGTTRDVIDVHLNIGGYPVILSDTAGLRPEELKPGATKETQQEASSHDTIEREGIRRARERAQEADIRLLVFDAAETTPDAATQALENDSAIRIMNKADIAASQYKSGEAIFISAKTGQGIETLLETLTNKLKTMIGVSRETPSLTRARHREALEACQSHIGRCLAATIPELAAEELRLAVRELGRITGRVDVEDLLDIIFRDFCIGK